MLSGLIADLAAPFLAVGGAIVALLVGRWTGERKGRKEAEHKARMKNVEREIRGRDAVRREKNVTHSGDVDDIVERLRARGAGRS